MGDDSDGWQLQGTDSMTFASEKRTTASRTIRPNRALAVIIAGLFLSMPGCASSDDVDARTSDSIDVTFYSTYFAGLRDVGQSCVGDGAEVMVRGASDQIVGVGNTGPGIMESLPSRMASSVRPGAESACVLQVEIEVSSDEFYQIDLQGFSVPPFLVPREDLEREDWTISLLVDS